MRVVIDTNVLVSGLLSETGPPGQIVGLLFHGDLQPIFSAAILAEYRDVLARSKFGFDRTECELLLGVIKGVGFQVEPLPWPVQLPDTDDEAYLAAAEATNAPLITGNLRHYPKRGRRSVTVLSPAEFIEWMRDRR